MDENSNTSENLICSYPGCGKLLSSKYNLKRHVESCHYGYRPYECHVCYKRFSSKQNKREHIRLEHSYSIPDETLIEEKNLFKGQTMQIPYLSDLICNSLDPDIRPMAKVEKIFLYSDLCEKVELPCLSEERKQPCTLPFDP